MENPSPLRPRAREGKEEGRPTLSLADSGSYFIWATVTLAVGVTVAGTTLDTLEDQADAQRRADEAEILEDATGLGNVTATFEGGTLTLALWNTGERTVSLDDVTVLLDGEVRTDVVRSLVASAGSDVWEPGEQATFTVSDLTSTPSRVSLTTLQGADSVVVFETPGAPTANVYFERGPGGSNPRYFSHFAMRSDNASFSATFKGKNGADTRVAEVARLVNADASDATVNLSGGRVTNANVEWFRWSVRSASATVGELDYTSTSPWLVVTIPAGTTYAMDLRLDLKDGSGKHNALTDFTLRLEDG